MKSLKQYFWLKIIGINNNDKKIKYLFKSNKFIFKDLKHNSKINIFKLNIIIGNNKVTFNNIIEKKVKEIILTIINNKWIYNNLNLKFIYYSFLINLLYKTGK